MNIGTLSARLQRIRNENVAGRSTFGLGAVNIPFAQRYGAGLGANVSLYAALNTIGDQSRAAAGALSRFDRSQAAVQIATEAKQTSAQALIEARRAAAEARRAFAMAQFAGDPGALPAADRIRRGRIGAGPKGISKAGFAAGPLRLGRGGLRLATGGLRGPLGAAFTVGLANHIVGASMNQIADLRDSFNDLRAKGATTGEIARAGGAQVGRMAAGLLGAESIAGGLLRLAGNSQETSDRLVQRAMDQTFLTREELQRRRDAKREAMRNAIREVAKVQAQERKWLDDYEPMTFRPRTSDDRRAYRRELIAANAAQQEIKKHIRIDLATREAKGE